MNNSKALSRRNPTVEVRLVVVRGGCEVTEICGGAATEVAATVVAAVVVVVATVVVSKYLLSVVFFNFRFEEGLVGRSMSKFSRAC